MKKIFPISGALLLFATLTIGVSAKAGTPFREANIGPAFFSTSTFLALNLMQDAEHAEVAEHDESAPTDDHADGGDDAHADDGHGEADLGQERAAALAVQAPPAWFGKVIWGSGLLFVLAATLGSAAIVLKGPEPADPADDHGHH